MLVVRSVHHEPAILPRQTALAEVLLTNRAVQPSNRQNGVFSHSPQRRILNGLTRRFYSRIVGLGLSLDVTSRFRFQRHMQSSNILHQLRNEISIMPPSSVTGWHGTQALWTAFGIFMPFIIDPGLAGAEDSNCEPLSEAGGQFFKPSNEIRMDGDQSYLRGYFFAWISNGIDWWYSHSASVLGPSAVLSSGPDGRCGPPKSNEEVKEKEEKVDDEEDEGDKKNEKMKAVEDEITEKFKMALRITASKSLRKQIVR
ncbi:hypothetical protein CNMCM6936_004539 [Aspergillus lentulus]|nr:hypothetical protein CNMCM6936_004539 [Aspergillus lentulus]KAF4174835.1 hypothetical protein CNMCM8060_008051 [Aspergillus lentulus]KAF4195012.1 hypothetical protein CNMCM8694_006906 [Aspergillus lentulus]